MKFIKFQAVALFLVVLAVAVMAQGDSGPQGLQQGYEKLKRRVEEYSRRLGQADENEEQAVVPELESRAEGETEEKKKLEEEKKEEREKKMLTEDKKEEKHDKMEEKKKRLQEARREEKKLQEEDYGDYDDERLLQEYRTWEYTPPRSFTPPRPPLYGGRGEHGAPCLGNRDCNNHFGLGKGYRCVSDPALWEKLGWTLPRGYRGFCIWPGEGYSRYLRGADDEYDEMFY